MANLYSYNHGPGLSEDEAAQEREFMEQLLRPKPAPLEAESERDVVIVTRKRPVFTRTFNTPHPADHRGEWVYFIKDHKTGLVKIGHTATLHKRFREIYLQQLSLNSKITFLGAIMGSKEDEAEIHKMFQVFRQPDNPNVNPSEWFRLEEPIRFFIKMFCNLRFLKASVYRPKQR